MPTWGDSQRYSVDYSNTMWGSDINFIVMQAQDVWIRTLYDRHRFVVRGNLGWIEADNFDKVPPDLRFSPGAIAVFAAINTNPSRRRTMTAS
jgi:translocation and assembly module TamA